MRQDLYFVVIPYINREAQGDELRYAIEGWRKHCKTPCHIIVVGDVNPCFIGDPFVTYIPKSRQPEMPGQYLPHIDHVHKMMAVYERLGHKMKGFVQVADDCYAVNDFTIEDVLFPKVFAEVIPAGDINDENGFYRDQEKTRLALVGAGLPTRNWTTHLPRYYDWEKYIDIIDQYNCGFESYIIEDLYYNTYYAGIHPYLLKEHDHYIERLESMNTPIIGDSIWLSNSVYGWSPKLESFLKQHYEIK